MNDYVKATFFVEPYNEVQCDILAALLCEVGFESFEQNVTGIDAYIQQSLFDTSNIEQAISQYDFSSKITWKCETIEGRDWNEEWEKNYFTPMVIAD